MYTTYENQREADRQVIAGFLYHSEYDEERDACVCRIVGRAEPDVMFGVECRFLIEFPDGVEKEVLAHQLSPWYQVESVESSGVVRSDDSECAVRFTE